MVAQASAYNSFTTTTTGGTTTTVYSGVSSARATGIAVNGGVNTMTITNTGAINVDAITMHGGDATAYGIRATSNGDATPLATDILTINNSGDIIVRQSSDGGDTFFRGMAIDVAGVPNQTVINLMAPAANPSDIYGNIDVKTGDAINVTTGETVFNGIINPECMPVGGPTALTLDSAALSSCGQGALTLSSGGDLHMVIDGNEGPSYAFVDTFTVNSGGTLELDLPPAVGTAPIGTYPQIYAETATLNAGSTLIANIEPGSGLYETTVYENVIDANALTGTFTNCIVTGVPASSLLLDFGCVYPPAAGVGNVDLKLTRIAFDEVPGLNDNGGAVGSGLECIYDVNMTGSFAQMFGDLFLITDPADYNEALNQLSGSVYANYLQSMPSLGVHYNDLFDHATNCEIPALAGSVLECRASSPLHVWGQLDYQWRTADADIEAGRAKADRFTGLIGIDAAVGNAAILGIGGGYAKNTLNDNQFGDHVTSEGFVIGAYGVYDPGAFFAKVMGSYSQLNGSAFRNIDFTPFGGTFKGQTDSSPDSDMWTLGVHGGARLPMGGTSVITPYLNYDYVDARLKAFTENGLEAARLTVADSHSKHSFLTGGVKWATQMGGLVPEVNLGYRYRFDDERSYFTAAFNGDTDCDFVIRSAAANRGTFLAGISVGGKIGPADIRIGYEGEFNEDITSHRATSRLSCRLVGARLRRRRWSKLRLRRRHRSWSRRRLRRPRRLRRLRRLSVVSAVSKSA